MNTVSKTIETLSNAGSKMVCAMTMDSDLGCFEVGAMQVIKRAEGQLTSTYALMVANGILPSDYLSAKNKESTASVEQYAARVEASGLICYTKTERAELATKLPKDAPAEQKASRKVLQDRRTELLKTVRRGLTTAHKLAHPEEYVSGGANEPKTAIEDLAALMEKATKLLQGDKPFPDTFAHDDAIAVLKGFVKTFC
tara:strand:+ start:821 stop:1414 length:594 start_codon:yes stop_codon:yes gene_type:complete